MAVRHGIKVVYEEIPDGREAYTLRDTVVLNCNVYAPRVNYAFCHELAHILLGHPLESTLRIEIEREADRLAAELMLPEVDFRQQMRRRTLPELKDAYPHASWEVIARRWAEFRPAVLTIYDRFAGCTEKLTARTAADGFGYPPRPTTSELKIITTAFTERTHQSAETDSLVLQAYYIDDGRGVERVILLTEVKDYFG